VNTDELNAEFGDMAVEKRALLDEERGLVNRLRRMGNAAKEVAAIVESHVHHRPYARDDAVIVDNGITKVQTGSGVYNSLFEPHEFSTAVLRLLAVRRRLAELTETLGF